MMLKYSVTIRKMNSQTRQHWCPWQPWWKFTLLAFDWQLATNAGSDPFHVDTVTQYTPPQCCVYVCVFLWVCVYLFVCVCVSVCVCVCAYLWTTSQRQARPISTVCIDSVGTRHPGFQRFINQLCSWNRSAVPVCVGLSFCVCETVCLYLGHSQREWLRQQHDNGTSLPFIPATRHSGTEKKNNLKSWRSSLMIYNGHDEYHKQLYKWSTISLDLKGKFHLRFTVYAH